MNNIYRITQLSRALNRSCSLLERLEAAQISRLRGRSCLCWNLSFANITTAINFGMQGISMSEERSSMFCEFSQFQAKYPTNYQQVGSDLNNSIGPHQNLVNVICFALPWEPPCLDSPVTCSRWQAYLRNNKYAYHEPKMFTFLQLSSSTSPSNRLRRMVATNLASMQTILIQRFVLNVKPQS